MPQRPTKRLRLYFAARLALSLLIFVVTLELVARWALPDGYYVVLVVDRNGSRAHALHRLRRAAEVFAKEIS